jgi:tagatose-6-phosphate ketose/aldose isomerase
MPLLNYDESALRNLRALHTAREITQQPQSWLRTAALVRELSPRLQEFLARPPGQAHRRVILTGAGSSAFIGEALGPLLTRRLGGRFEPIATTDLLAAPHSYLQRDLPTLLVSFGRSGNSPESLAVVELAERLVTRCEQLVLTCNPDGALYRRCRDRTNSLAVLLPPETHDESFAMTSSFTSMMLAAWLGLTGAALGVEEIARAGERVIAERGVALQELAAQSFGRVVYLGSGALRGLAREAALKLLEMTDGRIVATSDSPLGFRHGPKAIINGETLVFVLVSNDPYTRRYDLDLLRELRSDGRAGRVVAIAAGASGGVTDGDFLLTDGLSEAEDISLLFPYIVCAQLYAFHRALALGNSPDEPIASGTVNRVVRGVTIHPL